MISLIAADMDGTLLDSDGKIPAHFQEIFQRLQEENILFTVASGRQYYSLAKSFQDMSDNIVFIAENGTYVVYKGETLYLDPIPLSDVREICSVVKKLPHSAVVMCGRKSAYIERSADSEQTRFLEEITRYYVRKEYVDSLAEVEDDILKFGICTFDGAEETALPYLLPYTDRFSVRVSGKFWLDIAKSGSNKGIALTHIQEHFGISRDRTMAFGDFLNDIELLQNAKYSYAMANSHPDLFQHANFQAAANYEDGVLRQIVQMLDNPREYE